MHQSHVSLSYAGPRIFHCFGDINELPSVQNDVEDALPPDNRLAEGARRGSDSTVSTAPRPPRRHRCRRRHVRPSGARIALERTVGVSGSSNLAHMFAESRGGIHIHSALRSSHTILAQVNSPTETGSALTEPVEPVPTSHYAMLDGPNIIHTVGNFAQLPLNEPDEPVPTADEHNKTIHASSVRLPPTESQGWR